MSVDYEQRGRVAVITIDRPERRNAIDAKTATELYEAWMAFDADGEVDVAVLTGSGDVFSAGADLKSFDLIDRPEGFLGFTRVTVSKPTIAAIEGYCVAGGLEMALWCDLRVSGEGATFGCFERRFGVPLVDGGTQRLPRIVGQGLALELILTGRPVDAAEAHAIGLVNAVVDDGMALAAAIDIAERIAQFPQATVRSDRRALYEGMGLSEDEGLALERIRGMEVWETAKRGADRFGSGAGRGGKLVGWLSAVKQANSEAERVPDPDTRPVDHLTDAETEVSVGDSGVDPVSVDDAPHAVVVAVPELHTIWGLPPAASGRPVLVIGADGPVDAETEAHVERLANAGFLTVAVDLPAFANSPPHSIASGVQAAIDRLLRHPAAAGDGPALVGFGRGGGVALWYSTVDPRIRVVAAYAGRLPSTSFTPNFPQSRAAYIGHYAKDDKSVDWHYAYDLEMTLRDRGVDATFNIYPKMSADFYSLVGEPAPGAEMAFRRTVSLLSRTL